MRKIIFFILFISMISSLLSKSYYVNEYVSNIDVNVDGSLDIVETMQYVFEEGSFSWVNREINAPKNGFIILESAFIDGSEVAIGDSTGSLRLKAKDNFEAKFLLDNVSQTTMTFRLHYRVFNAFSEKGEKAVLDWIPLPENYNFVIKKGRVRIDYPDNIPMYDIISFLDSGKEWNFTEEGHSLVCTFSNIKNKSFEVKSTIPLALMQLKEYQSPFSDIDLLVIHPHLKPYISLYKALMIALAIFLLVIICILITRYNRVIKNLPKLNHLPSHKHPILVARLLQVGSDDVNIIPVLMYMAIKGIVKFTQKTDSNGKLVNDFYVDINKDLSQADDYDQAYLSLIEKEEQRREKRVELKSLLNNSYRYKKNLLKFISVKFYETGLVDPIKKKKNMISVIRFFFLLIIGVVLLILGVVFFVRGHALAPLPAFIVVGCWIYRMLSLDDKNILTEKGLEKWKEWKAYKRYLGACLQGKNDELDPYDAEEIFPYALLMGYGQQYLRYFKKRNINLNFPSLGEVAKDIETLNTLITVVVISTAVGGSAGTTGGGGGAGAG